MLSIFSKSVHLCEYHNCGDGMGKHSYSGSRVLGFQFKHSEHWHRQNWPLPCGKELSKFLIRTLQQWLSTLLTCLWIPSVNSPGLGFGFEPHPSAALVLPPYHGYQHHCMGRKLGTNKHPLIVAMVSSITKWLPKAYNVHMCLLTSGSFQCGSCLKQWRSPPSSWTVSANETRQQEHQTASYKCKPIFTSHLKPDYHLINVCMHVYDAELSSSSFPSVSQLSVC